LGVAKFETRQSRSIYFTRLLALLWPAEQVLQLANKKADEFQLAKLPVFPPLLFAKRAVWAGHFANRDLRLDDPGNLYMATPQSKLDG